MKPAARLVTAAAIVVAGLSGAAFAADVRGVTDKEIVIGTVSDLSGIAAQLGVSNSNAFRLAFEQQNAKGGINGRKIRYVVEDMQYQVPRAVQAANKLLNLDNVMLMVGNVGTPMNEAIMPMEFAKGVPNLFPLTSARSMYEPLNHLKFALNSSYYDQIRTGLKYLIETQGKKTVCVMYQDTDFGRDILAGVRDQLKAQNMSLGAATAHKPTDTDFSTDIAKLRDAKCDLIALATIIRDTNQILAAARQIGWTTTFVGAASSFDTPVAEAPGGVSEGFYAATPFLFVALSDQRPEVQEFTAAYKARYGRDPNVSAQSAYTGAEIVIAALQRAGKDLSGESFVAALETINDWHDRFGSPPLSFSASKHQASNSSFLAVVKDGKWVPVTTGALTY